MRSGSRSLLGAVIGVHVIKRLHRVVGDPSDQGCDAQGLTDVIQVPDECPDAGQDQGDGHDDGKAGHRPPVRSRPDLPDGEDRVGERTGTIRGEKIPMANWTTTTTRDSTRPVRVSIENEMR